jgi:hypothetical protein
MFAKIAKTIIGALVLTSVSCAVTTSAYSEPRQAPSQTKDRHNPTDPTDPNGKPAAPPPVVLPGDGRT